MKTYFDVIFLNNGDIILQVGTTGFVHTYDDPAQAAQDVKILLDGGNTAGWDGNEPAGRMIYDLQTEVNGAYIWHNQTSIKSIISAGALHSNHGCSFNSFYAALGVQVPED